MTPFAARLSAAMGPGGYDGCMRRCIQTAVLYEAQRCLAERLPSLRPFQRRIALYDTANHLLDSLPLPEQTKREVMYKTATSKEALTSENAWKRMKVVHRDIEKIVRKIRPFLANRSFDEACEAFIQAQYELVSGNKGKEPPRHWVHCHNNVFMTYRMYYKGEDLDPDLPPAKPPKPIVVPAQRPKKELEHKYYLAVPNDSPPPEKDPDINEGELEAIVNQGSSGAGENNTADDRRLVLKEVRDHLDLLKEFDGVIPVEELNKRKRDLFLALPPAPPPALSGGRKKTRVGEIENTADV